MDTTEYKQNDAILLIAHGSRRKQANDDLVELAKQIQSARSGMDVQIGYLELTEPSIPDGAAACVQNGARRVFLLPYFLSAGTHVANDLEDFCKQFEADYSGVSFSVCQPIGLHPLVSTILLERLDQKLSDVDAPNDQNSEQGIPASG